MNHEFKLLINGRLAAGATHSDVVNPATARALASCPRASEAQLNEAVAAAKIAFKQWSQKPLNERRQLLLQLADAMEKRVPEFTRLLVQEQGKPIAQAQREVGGCVMMMRAMSQMELPPKVLKDTEQQRIVQLRVPLGVVAAIMPWNFPILLLVLKVTPALLAGNTVVAKPAPTTPLTALLFGELCVDVLPAGVLNIIADRNDLGGALTQHPDVAKVAFTGSTATDRKVMASGAGTLKRLTLELGGNDAAIVLDDVDVKELAPKIFAGATTNAGQICVAVKRVYVPESMYEPLCNELAALAEKTVVGDGLQAETQMGPLQNQAQYERVKGLLDDTRRHGRIIAGGRAIERDGYFIAPTIVRDIADNTRLVREEQFGPVLPVLKYSSLDEAIARANDTEYGLGGSVWSNDLDRAYEVAVRMDSGSIWVNKSSELNPEIPSFGAKQSGLGVELGQVGFDEYTQNRIINVSRA